MSRTGRVIALAALLALPFSWGSAAVAENAAIPADAAVAETAAIPADAAAAPSEPVYRLLLADGRYITSVAGDVGAGDEYISQDNRLYRVSTVDDSSLTATLSDEGAFALPDVAWLDAVESLPVFAPIAGRKVALYCTHSDESYVPTDGKSSSSARGGIYNVAAAIAEAFEADGVTASFSRATHHPHDAGAYRRSRQTAVQLLKEGPDALFDVHRDGIKDTGEYATTIGGKNASKVRLLVGRQNQNAEANLRFASLVKAIADKTYPGLIKDIYRGRGSYNQDLAPHSLLIEMGTYTLSKERALTSAPLIAEVLQKALYGGVTGAAGASDVSGRSQSAQAEEKRGGGAVRGILIAVGVLVVGLLVYAMLSAGGVRAGFQKFGRSVREMGGGLFGGRGRK